jgi:prepilin-type N-terminal cleavage/methylation domain-containing protein
MKAFTLVEVLVSIVIMSLIMGVVYGLIVVLYRTQEFALQQAAAVDEARRGIEIMVREIREAQFGEEGSYVIERASDKEFIFYGDIDKDGEIEKVRYFLGAVNSVVEIKESVTFSDGGNCNIVFSDFLEGNLISAQAKIFVEGDFGWSIENADINVDGNYFGKICQSGCSDCAGNWQGNMVFDVTDQAEDGYLEFLVDSTSNVDNVCDWQESNHSMKVKVELSFEQEIPELAHQFKKGVTNPTVSGYPEDQEEVTIITSYVRNTPPIFEYYNLGGEKIIDEPIRVIDATLMKVYLIVNINPITAPKDFELESYVQLRNLKEEY